jgi:hypothetical protein
MAVIMRDRGAVDFDVPLPSGKMEKAGALRAVIDSRQAI